MPVKLSQWSHFLATHFFTYGQSHFFANWLPESCFWRFITEMIMFSKAGTFKFCWDLLYWRCSTLISASIINYIHYQVWDEITNPLPDLNGSAMTVWEWISIFYLTLYRVCNYFSTLGLKLIYAGKRASWFQLWLTPSDTVKPQRNTLTKLMCT